MGAHGEQAFGIKHLVVHREHQHAHRWILRTQLPQYCQPIIGAQGEVQNHYFWLQALHRGQRRCGTVRLATNLEIRLTGEQLVQPLTHQGVVVHYEHTHSSC